MTATIPEDFDGRERMVSLIRRRGISDPAICEAFRSVARERFVPEEVREFAYQDAPLPIGKDQTISQPYMVALMVEAMRLGPQDRVLEIGAGSGYSAAVTAKIAAEVFTVERHAELAESARRRLEEEGFTNVHVLWGDGTLGWPENAPYDAIAVTAGGPGIPQPLLDQLAVGGRLVIPVGTDRMQQSLIRVTKTAAERFEEEDLGEVRFVPLVGVAGWQESGG